MNSFASPTLLRSKLNLFLYLVEAWLVFDSTELRLKIFVLGRSSVSKQTSVERCLSYDIRALVRNCREVLKRLRALSALVHSLSLSPSPLQPRTHTLTLSVREAGKSLCLCKISYGCISFVLRATISSQ